MQANAARGQSIGMLHLPYDSFNIHGPHGLHQCLVYEPMHSSLEDNLYHHRMTLKSAKPLVRQILTGLNYLHTECRIIHTGELPLLPEVRVLMQTDISLSNILLEQPNKRVWDDVEKSEIARPCWAVEKEGRMIYASLFLDAHIEPGAARLADFGLAVRGDHQYTHPIQPSGMEAPEVLIRSQWSYSADIWNFGVLVGLQLESTT
jgi:serine/threonine-protein kinase SRPK3